MLLFVRKNAFVKKNQNAVSKDRIHVRKRNPICRFYEKFRNVQKVYKSKLIKLRQINHQQSVRGHWLSLW